MWVPECHSAKRTTEIMADGAEDAGIPCKAGKEQLSQEASATAQLSP